MDPLPVGATIVAALAEPFRRFGAFLRCAVAPIAYVIVENCVGFAATGGKFMATASGLRFVYTGGREWIALALIVAGVLAYLMFAVSWQRQTCLGAGAEPAPLLRLDPWLRQYVLMALKLLGLLIVPVVAAAMLVAPALAQVPASALGAISRILVAVGFFVAIWWLLGRFSLGIASASVDAPPIGLIASWKATAPVQGRIFLILGGVALAQVLASLVVIHAVNALLMPIHFRFSPLPFVLFGLGNLAVSLIGMAWTLGAMSLIHRSYRAFGAAAAPGP